MMIRTIGSYNKGKMIRGDKDGPNLVKILEKSSILIIIILKD